MKRETKARIKSAALALMMVAASVPFSEFSPVVVAQAAIPQIAFETNKVENSPKVGEVITGREVEIRELNSGDRSSSKIVLRNKNDTQNIEANPEGVTNNEAVTIRRTGAIWNIKFEESFDLTTGKKETQEGTAKYKAGREDYTVYAVYNTETDTGISFERVPGAKPPGDSATVKSDRKFYVLDESKIVIKCTNGEMDPGGLAFEIANKVDENGNEIPDTLDVTGTFEKHTYVSPETIDNPTVGFPLGGKPKRQMVLLVGGPSGVTPYRFTIEIKGTNEIKDADDKGTGLYNNYIQKDTEFELVFSPDTSNEVLLNVMTPQQVMNELEAMIRSSDGSSNQKIIKLANGNELERIDTDFQVMYRSTLHHGKIDLVWDWGELEKNGNVEVSSEIIQDSEKNEWRDIEIEREEDDVSGQAVITVISYSSENKPTTTKTADTPENLPTRDFTIRGLGIPGDVTQYSYRQADKNNGLPDNYTLFTGKDTELPDAQKAEEVKMDAYRGGIPEFNQKPQGYYDYVLKLDMGAKNSTVTYAQVEVLSDNPEYVDFVELWADTEGKATDGSFKRLAAGGRLDNPKATAANKGTASIFYVKVVAKDQPTDKEPVSAGMRLKITYWMPDGAGELQPTEYIVPLRLYDSNPNQNSKLANIEIIDADTNEPIPFTVPFDPETKDYLGGSAVVIPFRTKNIKVRPTLQDQRGSTRPIVFHLLDPGKNIVEDIKGWEVDSDNNFDRYMWHKTESKTIPLVTDDDPNGMKTLEHVYTLNLVSPSQHPRKTDTYNIEFYRASPSEDNTLASLGVYLEDADPKDSKNNLIQNFDPKINVYDIWIPYSTKRLRVQSQKNDNQAVADDMVVTDLPNYKLEGVTESDRSKEWLKDVKQHFNDLPGTPTQPPTGSGVPPLEHGVMELKFTVTSEKDYVTQSGFKNTYRVRIHRELPKDDAFMSAFEVTNNDEEVLTYTPSFSPDTKTYTLEIPYSVKQIKFNITSNDPNVSEVELWETNTQNGKKLLWLTSNEAATALKLGVLTKGIDVQDMTTDYVKNNQGYHPFFIKIIPESEKKEYIQEYLLRVRRAEPSTDAKLKTLLLKDQENADIKTFGFHPDETEYHITVPYKTTGVSFTPTTNHQYAKVELSYDLLTDLFPYEVESGATSKVINLNDKPEVEKEFKVKVTAEDGKTVITYHVFIAREKPSDDARLKALKTENTSNFKPLFISSKTDYSADVNEGAPGVIITPTANHPGATIKVDGVVVQSGSPTDLIELLEIKQTVRIEVIAEDGVTRKVYKIEFTNQNLIEKTNNADLRRLAVNYGLMTPNFQSAVTDYEVTTKENAWSVDIVPRVADQYATMRVLNGTRELGDYNGNYALALADGENKVTIEVTSPDKTVKKNYDITIYRNEEEKLKNLEPLEAEDINFEQVSNPIIVKIEEYPRVGASVFNTIREEHPEMSIIFQGNDYSIRFDGKNLTRVIPQTEIYDFRMTFESPDEEAIYDLIGSRAANDDIIDDAVLCYFDYHGSLPGPATFSLSLGRRYANDTLYWHYYNQERDRIDYYGSLQSNTKGTVAVSIDHFSTYIVTPEHRIAGSEDKAGVIDELGMISNGQDLLSSGGKLNPDTGVEGSP